MIECNVREVESLGPLEFALLMYELPPQSSFNMTFKVVDCPDGGLWPFVDDEIVLSIEKAEQRNGGRWMLEGRTGGNGMVWMFTCLYSPDTGQGELRLTTTPPG